jgi:hypothetical protein
MSDAAESLVNLVGASVALIAVRVAARPPDDDHAYGHETGGPGGHRANGLRSRSLGRTAFGGYGPGSFEARHLRSGDLRTSGARDRTAAGIEQRPAARGRKPPRRGLPIEDMLRRLCRSPVGH